jgi:hypothetical protein
VRKKTEEPGWQGKGVNEEATEMGKKNKLGEELNDILYLFCI